MVLIIGGQSSGKLDYVLSLGYTPDMVADGVIDDRPVVYNLQDIIAKDPRNASELLPLLENKELVICNEVGSGVIPVIKNDRMAREATGRLCVLLAKKATKVIRPICGIPTVIKGS